MVQSKLLRKFPELNHYFFDKSDTKAFFRYNLDAEKIICVNQPHSNKVIFLDNSFLYSKDADGIITKRKTFLGIKTADCLPIFAYDPIGKLIAAVHAGWRGLFADIIGNSIRIMSKYNTRPEDVRVAIGPHIKQCCYEVNYLLVKQFSGLSLPKDIGKNHNSKWFLDLSKIAECQMKKAGIRQKYIDISNICTYCSNNFCSYRREGRIYDVINNVVGIISN